MAGQARQGAVLSTIPPPSAVVLVLSGLRGGMDHVAVREAIERFDPAARIWTNWPEAMVAVETTGPPEALRAAVQDAGYIATLRPAAAVHREERDLGAAIFRVIGLTFSGFVLGALVGAALGIGNVVLNPSCSLPGDSGACAMAIPTIAIGGGMVGGPVGFVLALFRRGRR